MPAPLIAFFEMFAFLFVELTLLFLAISFVVALLQHYIPPEKIERLLSSKYKHGYVIAALLGAITPFCSCSTIPFLKGLMRAKAGFGTILVFLFASPLLNPIIIGLFAVTFGWKIALYYFCVAMVVSVLAGFTLEKLGFERYVRSESATAKTNCGGASCSGSAHEPQSSCCGAPAPVAEKEAPASSSCCETAKPVQSKATTCCGSATSTKAANGSERLHVVREAWQQSWKDFKQVLPYLALGISIGSLIYGFLPADFIARYAGADNPAAIPIAAVIGVPLYIRAEAVIPISSALMAKGMGLGAVMALIIGSAGASLTEVILLRSIFKSRLILAFLLVIFTMAVGAGYLLDFFM
ncbi:permease [Polycladidibacter hongkongensis]|uniref:permease n=1 Tax=Polycladidibacter hongkongensis TaxID=1647556 RepID=UPI00082ED800|nr:permease [Pseudovibrio hongkongensis]